MSRADRLLNGCRCEAADCTPIWFLGQCGSHLQGYRELRQRFEFLDLVTSPESAAQITLMPVAAYGVDAAILFSDILPTLQSMGLRIELNHPTGPGIQNPIRSHADIESLAIPPIEISLDFTLKAIRQCCQELSGTVPLIGFAGAPFTLACYAVEGRATARFTHVKSLIYNDTQWWHKLMERLTSRVVEYLTAQAHAGAKAIQMFDSFVGVLSPYDFREYVLPHIQRMVKRFRENCPQTPLFYYGTDTAGLLPLIAEADFDVVSVDWKMDLPAAWSQLGDHAAIQGNLDPVLLSASEEEVQRQAARLLDAVGGRPGHIMNVGHTLPGSTPPENIKGLVDFVHNYSTSQ